MTHGRWFRQGDRIVMLLDEIPSGGEQEIGGDIQEAVQRGIRDENQLTDMVFYTRHPERRGQPLRSQEKDLIKEWLDIRDGLVRPALQAGPAPAHAAVQPPSTTSGVEAAGITTQLIPCILGLRDQGRAVSFVQRYLRDLTRAEIAALKKAGLRIVSCFEENGSDPPVTYFHARADNTMAAALSLKRRQSVSPPERRFISRWTPIPISGSARSSSIIFRGSMTASNNTWPTCAHRISNPSPTPRASTAAAAC